jgi:hypothetical protein
MERITLILSWYVLRTRSFSFLWFRLSHFLTFKSHIIGVLAFVLSTIFQESFCWKSFNLLNFVFSSFYSIMESKVSFTFLRTFLLSFTIFLWDFIDSNFGFQYWSDIGVLISKNLPSVLTALTIFVIPGSITW